jgi:hypothetical protein
MSFCKLHVTIKVRGTIGTGVLVPTWYVVPYQDFIHYYFIIRRNARAHERERERVDNFF